MRIFNFSATLLMYFRLLDPKLTLYSEGVQLFAVISREDKHDIWFTPVVLGIRA